MKVHNAIAISPDDLTEQTFTSFIFSTTFFFQTIFSLSFQSVLSKQFSVLSFTIIISSQFFVRYYCAKGMSNCNCSRNWEEYVRDTHQTGVMTDSWKYAWNTNSITSSPLHPDDWTKQTLFLHIWIFYLIIVSSNISRPIFFKIKNSCNHFEIYRDVRGE